METELAVASSSASSSASRQYRAAIWPRHKEARGVSPADGIAAMASSFAAQFKASLAASENTWARDLNVIFVSLGASVQAGLDSCPCILLVRICMCFEFLYVFVRLPDLNTDTSYQKKNTVGIWQSSIHAQSRSKNRASKRL